MDFESFRSTVFALKERKPVWFGLESDPPATEGEITVAENSLGVQLPLSYRKFVREFGGGYFAFGNVFSVSAKSDWKIVQRNRSFPIADFLAVSDNGTGDYYGFKCCDGRCAEPIYFWDHEDPELLKPTQFSDLFEFLEKDALSPR